MFLCESEIQMRLALRRQTHRKFNTFTVIHEKEKIQGLVSPSLKRATTPCQGLPRKSSGTKFNIEGRICISRHQMFDPLGFQPSQQMVALDTDERKKNSMLCLELKEKKCFRHLNEKHYRKNLHERQSLIQRLH